VGVEKTFVLLSRSARECLVSRHYFPFRKHSTLSSVDWTPWRSEGHGRGSPRFHVTCILFIRTL